MGMSIRLKNSCLIFLFLGSFSSAQAQMGNFFRFGVKGGVNLTTINTENLTYNGLNNFVVQNLEAKTGYVGGVYARIGRSFFIQPELLFSAKSATVNVFNSLSPSTSRVVDVAYNSLDVPIMLGYKLGIFHVLAGPVASYSMNPDNTISNAIVTNLGSVEDAVSKAYYSYTVGGGIDILGLTLDVRYEGNLTDLSKTVPLPTGLNFSQKASLWQATLGLKIL